MENKRSKNFIWTLISLLLAVLTVRVVIRQSKDFSFGELLSVIGSSEKVYLITGIVCAALYVVFEGVAICSILKYSEYPRSIRKGLIYSTADVYFSAITPSATGGQPASAFFMRRDGIPTGIATAILILNLMMYTVSIVALGFLSIFMDPGAFCVFSMFSKALIALGFVSLSILTMVFFTLLKNEELIFRPAEKLIRFLCKKKILKGEKRKIERINKIKGDYQACSDLISGRKRILFGAFFWNLVQRASQILVPMFIFASIGGEKAKMGMVFSKQCLVTIGYNYIPIPGGMGISDYLMIDGFSRMMGDAMAYSVELISRGITFYCCVAVSGVITLVGYGVSQRRG